jgi:mono/diheme cytochrome c family protein
MRATVLAVAALAWSTWPPPLAAGEPFDPEQFPKLVQPFLQKHCIACHKGTDAEADLDLKLFAKVEDLLSSRKTWQRVVR